MDKCDYTENHYCVQFPPCQNKTKQQLKNKQSKKKLGKIFATYSQNMNIPNI